MLAHVNDDVLEFERSAYAPASSSHRYTADPQNKVQYTQGGMLERLQQLPNLTNLGSMAKTYGGQLRDYRDALQGRFDQ